MPAGRPAHFDNEEQLVAKVQEYFDTTDFAMLTVTGLAYFLGFESRQSFYDYEEKEQFSYIIKRARLFIESSYELRLSGNSPTGAIFALKNMGWNDKQQVEHTGAKVSLHIEPDAGCEPVKD